MNLRVLDILKGRGRSVAVLLLLLAGTAAPYVFPGPVRFEPAVSVGLEDLMPVSLGDWRQVAVRDPADLPEAAQFNEYFQAMYQHPEYGAYSVSLEYTADSRRRFELHYPDVCHAVRGDRLVMHSKRELEARGLPGVSAAVMEWQHPNREHQALAAYWYVTAEGTTVDSVRLKWNQAMAGLLGRPEPAVLVRLDAFFEAALSPREREYLLTGVDDLLGALHRELPERDRTLLFNKLIERRSS